MRSCAYDWFCRLIWQNIWRICHGGVNDCLVPFGATNQALRMPEEQLQVSLSDRVSQENSKML